jgi:hypothetical protein
MRFRLAANLLAILFSVILIPAAVGQEIRNVTVGWGDAIRLGRWTPVFVTVEDAQPREIDLQIHGTYGEKSEALWLHQTAVAQPLPVTYCLLYPINAQLSRIEVIVSDAQSGRTLGTRTLQDDSAFSPASRMPIRLLAPNDIHIGISGNVDDAESLKAQLKRAGVSAGILDAYHLPANFAGYDGVSVLILAAPDFDQIKLDQEQAILEWVNRGGNLLLIPPATPLPQSDPLIAALPCTIGTNFIYTMAAGTAASRPSTLNARKLSPRPGAIPIPVLTQICYLSWIGLGKIAVSSVNISPLGFVDDRSANDFWKSLLQPMVKIDSLREPTSLTVSDEAEILVPGPNAGESVGRGQRESDAIRHILQMIGATESVQRIHWTSAFLWLAGICFFLGPVDSIIMMRLGQRPQNWLTLLASGGLIASLAGFAIASGSTSSPTIATFRLMDQVNDSVVAATDVIAVNANHPRWVPLSLDKNEWWEPANQGARLLRSNRFVDANCRQDKTGCRPEWVNLSGMEAQAWHGEAADLGLGLLKCHFHLSQGSDKLVHLVGKLTNISTTPMTDIQISTSAGNFKIAGPLAPGATIDLDQPPSSNPISFPGLPADVTDISPERADPIDALVKSGQAEVICQMPDAANVRVGSGTQDHWQILRAILPLSK